MTCPGDDDRLDAMPFAVVDVETTGTRADGTDRITEIAVVPVDGGVVGTPYTQLVDPERPIPWFITRLTGISDALVAGAPTFAVVAPLVRDRLAGRVFVAHNAAFDWRFVQAECARVGDGALPAVRARLCTVRLARRFLPTLPRKSLDQVAAHFGVPIDGRHRAGGDALATARALVGLLWIAQDRGLETWGALRAALERRGPQPPATHPTLALLPR
jgi:DNA polymerase-3 subunit epsilon